jgi:alpha-galactosidase
MNQISATKLHNPLDSEGLPDNSAWEAAQPVTFCSDWRAENADPMRETTVQLLWSSDYLFIRFYCRYRDIYSYDGNACRRDELWMRDVAEVFIRRESGELRHYKEFEISPNGDWLDLDIAPGIKTILFCDLRSRVVLNSEQRTWTAEMAIPMDCLTTALDPGETWRLNLFRIEGRNPDRFYSSWIPTFTAQPNFHVPEVFGALKFKY